MEHENDSLSGDLLYFIDSLFKETKSDMHLQNLSKVVNILPKIEPIDKTNPNKELIKSKLQLNFNIRYPIIINLLSEPKEVYDSEDDKKYVSILCLQSYCSIFFNNENNFDFDIFQNYIKLLKKSLKLSLDHSNYVVHAILNTYSILLEFPSQQKFYCGKILNEFVINEISTLEIDLNCIYTKMLVLSENILFHDCEKVEMNTKNQFFTEIIQFFCNSQQHCYFFVDYIENMLQKYDDKEDLIKKILFLLENMNQFIHWRFFNSKIFDFIYLHFLNSCQNLNLLLDFMFLFTKFSCDSKNINWNQFSKFFHSKLALNDEIYHKILIILSLSQNFNLSKRINENCNENSKEFFLESFEIINKNVVFLIKPILYSNHAVPFLTELENSVKNNVINSIKFFQYQALHLLLDELPFLYDKEIQKLALSIISYVLTFVCDKETGIKFQKLFYSLNPKKLFLENLKNAFSPNPLKCDSYLQFRIKSNMNHNSNIKLPGFSADFLNNGITFVFEILISCFKESHSANDKTNYLPLILISGSKNENLNFYQVDAFKNKIRISSSLFSEICNIEIDELPLNRWFTFFFHIKKLNHFEIYINQNHYHYHVSQTPQIWNSPIDKIELFYQKNELNSITDCNKFNKINDIEYEVNCITNYDIEGLLNRIMLFNGNINENVLTMNDKYYRTVSYFSPLYVYSGNKLKNLTNLEDATFLDTFYEQFTSTFYDVFVNFKCLSEIIVYFTIDKLNNQLIYELFDFLIFLFSKIPELQKEMQEINGFHLISHFLSQNQEFEIDNTYLNNLLKFDQSLTDYSLQSNFRDTMILNFPKIQNLNDELYMEILEIWQTYDSSFFRERIVFSKFCGMIYYQAVENQRSLKVKTMLLDFLLINSEYFEYQDISLLIQLSAKIDIHNHEFSSSIIQIIQIIFLDHPSLSDLIYSDLIELNKSPEILCLIVQLFDQEEFLKNLLFHEICVERTLEEKKEFVRCICNSIVAHEDLSFEELLKIKNTCVVAGRLIPFILAFGCDCDENLINFISDFLANLFSVNECAKFVSRTITPVSLLVFVSFAVFKTDKFLHCLLSLILSKLSLLADSLRLIDILSSFCRMNLSDYQALIINTFLVEIFDQETLNSKSLTHAKIKDKDDFDVDKIIEIIVNFICFGPRRSVFDLYFNKNQSFEFKLADFLKAYTDYPVRINKYEYGLVFNGNGKWIFQKTAELLLLFLEDKKYELNEDSINSILIIFSYLLHNIPKTTATSNSIDNKLMNDSVSSKSYQIPIQSIVNFLKVIKEHKQIINRENLLPILVVISQNNYNNIHISDFLNTFQVESHKIEQYNYIMSKFISNLHEVSEIETALLKGLAIHTDTNNTQNTIMNNEDQNLDFDSSNKKNSLFTNNDKKKSLKYQFDDDFEYGKISIEDVFSDLKQQEITLRILREKMYRKLRPVYNDNQFRRYNLYDTHFRPIILTNTERINFVQIDSPNLLISTTKTISKKEKILWTSRCQRITLDQTFDGYFSVTEKGYWFLTTKGKSQFIRKNSVRTVFWSFYNNEPRSFTFYLLKGKCLMFHFFEPETRESLILNLNQIELNNCYFFQLSEGYKELGRLRLTEKWRERSLSNFDYIMWLNLLSGRSFLDPNFYPIFPMLFGSNDDKSILRDLSKNVLFMNTENISKWKTVKKLLDPYESYLLNQTFSTQTMVRLFLNSINQFSHQNMSNQHSDYPFGNEHNSQKDHDKDSKTDDSEIYNDLKIKLDNIVNQIESFCEIIDGLNQTKIHTELIPEFYFLPVAFKKWEKFPIWAKTSARLVLLHSSVLESEEVSLNLHHWIDLIWGVNQNINVYNPDLSFISEVKSPDFTSKNGRLPIFLFAGPHPARSFVPTFLADTHSIKITKVIKSSENVSPLSLGFLSSNSNSKDNHIFVLFSNEKVAHLKHKEIMSKSESFEIISLPKKYCYNIILSIFYKSFFYFVQLGTKHVNCYDISTKQIYLSKTSPHLQKVTCIDSIEFFTVTGSADSSIVSWVRDFNRVLPFTTLLVHEKPIKLVKIVENLKILLSCDVDGKIAVSVFPFLRFIKFVKLHFIPQIIDMTRTCIIAISDSHVESFTANGEKITERDFKEFKIVKEVAVEVITRSDVVAIATDLNEVLLLNCVTLEIVGVLVHLNSPISLMKFNQYCGKVIIVTNENEIIFVQVPD
ncbi:hypothetical protein TRFO_36292 [Tritrichomonas foetus]|uniref:BEACH domain-containing protein n=1 Tax=Tritrichomonas foetus TaxID=1144522 RepID=A0A1J4JIX2_9EUKA|nr:hypothetical protein TRFO_36292 [Tritrichomonas foetus]|eukprot:OHS97501.1 hypothetical protein TRFO_36292 [Tritrichomonas foetus]